MAVLRNNGDGTISQLATEALASVSAAESAGTTRVSQQGSLKAGTGADSTGPASTDAGSSGAGVKVGESGSAVVSTCLPMLLGVIKEAVQPADQSASGAGALKADVSEGSAEVSGVSQSGDGGGDLSKVGAALRALARVSEALPAGRVVVVPAVAREATGLFAKASLVSASESLHASESARADVRAFASGNVRLKARLPAVAVEATGLFARATLVGASASASLCFSQTAHGQLTDSSQTALVSVRKFCFCFCSFRRWACAGSCSRDSAPPPPPGAQRRPLCLTQVAPPTPRPPTAQGGPLTKVARPAGEGTPDAAPSAAVYGLDRGARGTVERVCQGDRPWAVAHRGRALRAGAAGASRTAGTYRCSDSWQFGVRCFSRYLPAGVPARTGRAAVLILCSVNKQIVYLVIH